VGGEFRLHGRAHAGRAVGLRGRRPVGPGRCNWRGLPSGASGRRLIRLDYATNSVAGLPLAMPARCANASKSIYRSRLNELYAVSGRFAHPEPPRQEPPRPNAPPRRRTMASCCRRSAAPDAHCGHRLTDWAPHISSTACTTARATCCRKSRLARCGSSRRIDNDASFGAAPPAAHRCAAQPIHRSGTGRSAAR